MDVQGGKKNLLRALPISSGEIEKFGFISVKI
jgi:hypothetical protein